jgi:hypothetical protein
LLFIAFLESLYNLDAFHVFILIFGPKMTE